MQFGRRSIGTSHRSYFVRLTHPRLTSAQPLHAWRCSPAVALLGTAESGGMISVRLGSGQPEASGGRWNEQGAIHVVRLTHQTFTRETHSGAPRQSGAPI